MKSIAGWLLLCCFSHPVIAQTETVVTVDISMIFIKGNRSETEEVMQGHLRCYKNYIVERIMKINMDKIKKPSDVKPPFFNDTSFYFINTVNNRYVHYDAFSANAKPSEPEGLLHKQLGIRMMPIFALDSASRIADTTISGIKYIRYYGVKERSGLAGSASSFTEITAYLLPVQNTSLYSYHRKTEQAAQGRFAWVEIRNDKMPTSYITIQFAYETREIPAQQLKVIDSWIARTKW